MTMTVVLKSLEKRVSEDAHRSLNMNHPWVSTQM